MTTENIISLVEAASNELRAGRPVAISCEGKSTSVVGVEPAAKDNLDNFTHVIITAKRASVITGENVLHPVKIVLDDEVMSNLLDITGIAVNPINSSLLGKVSNAKICSDKGSLAATELAKIGEIVPAVLVCKGGANVSVGAEDVLVYPKVVDESLVPICTAPLTLANAKNAEITVFRAKHGSKEHYSILIGNPDPDKVPLVRIHSACFTGDVLASLTCDCRDQLQDSLDIMQKNGGGVLLYLLQDGRGIGLVNKLRAYSLQRNGFDTVDANEFLGFDDDERPFYAAATMLRNIGFEKVRLLTNNPKKVTGLESCGIEVERVGHLVSSNEHNNDYMETKFNKMGHLK